MLRNTGSKFIIFTIVSILLLTACSTASNHSATGNNSANSTQSADTGTKSDSNTANSTVQNSDEKTSTGSTPIGLSKYNQPITLTTVVSTDTSVQKFAKGQDYNHNVVYDQYKKDLGIIIKNKWEVDHTQYDQKVNLTIASGDLPDLMEVSAAQLQQLVDNGEIADLSGVWNKYATDFTKNLMTADGGTEMNTAKFGGKLMAIPSTSSPYLFAEFLYARKDWMDKLHLSAPKSMDDVIKIAKAFANQDPDGDGKKDTYAFVNMKEIYNQAYSFLPFFYGYHAYPGAWIDNGSGKLVYGSVQPEMKKALQALQDLYKASAIDPEFYVKDHGKANELVANNKAGLAYGPFWLPSWPMASAVVKNKKVTQNWVSVPLVSADSQKVMTEVGMADGPSTMGQGVNGYYVVRKGYKHPEAVIKMLNKFLEADNKNLTPTDPDYSYKFDQNKDEMWKLNPVIASSENGTVKLGNVLPNAIQKKDPSAIKDNHGAMVYYQDAMDYENGNADKWSSYMKSRPGGTISIMKKYKDNGQYLFNKFTGPPTPTMKRAKSTLDTKEQALFVKIITNKAPVSAFDDFVKEWKKEGGDQMTKEVNDWYAKKNGK